MLLTERDILAEDNHIVIVRKPVGVLSQGSRDNGAPDLVTLLSERERLRGAKDPEVRVVHRLDCNVGGAMVYAKKPYAAAVLSAMIAGDAPDNGTGKTSAGRAFLKEYLCVVEGVPAEPQARLCDLLWKDSAQNKAFVVDRKRVGVKEARLSYTCLASKEADGQTFSLLRVRLETGRSHQIRAQLSFRGLPIAGDGKYGSRTPCVCDGTPALALWSFRLAFEHPANAERHKDGRRPNPKAPRFADPDISCPPPETMAPFSLFTEEIRALTTGTVEN